MFKEIQDIAVARYTGSIDNFSKTIIKISDFFSGSKKDTLSEPHEGHYTRNFDWDGGYIFTPCDCFLAANSWRAYDGNFINRYNGDTDESYATMLSLKCGSGVIFGNGLNLYYSENYKNPLKFTTAKYGFEIESLSTDNIGKAFFAISGLKNGEKEGVYLFFGKRNYSVGEEFKLGLILIPNEESSPSRNLTTNSGRTVHLPSATGKFVGIYNSVQNNYINEISYLYIIDYINEKKLFKFRLKGIQDVSKHPVKDYLAVIGKELTIVSYIEGKIVKSVELPIARRESNYEGIDSVICYSRCGRYIALTYSVTGEVEIRNAESLNIEFILEGYGIPQGEMSWDITSNFLACRFRNRERYEYILIVWDLRTRQVVLKTPSSRTEVIHTGFKWSETSTTIACLVDQKRIKIFQKMG